MGEREIGVAIVTDMKRAVEPGWARRAVLCLAGVASAILVWVALYGFWYLVGVLADLPREWRPWTP